MPIEGPGKKYPQEYLDGINDIFVNRMDGNGGEKDGKVTVKEAYNDLNIGDLLSGLKEGSAEYNKLKALTDKVPDALKKYAGADGIFQAEEWADFLNGNEWGAVLDRYHSSSNFAKIEMGWVDMSHIRDGQCTKGEVKDGLLNNLQKMELPLMYDKRGIGTRLEAIVDKYAGEDGTFTVAEYTAMKNDPEYKLITKYFNLVPFDLTPKTNTGKPVDEKVFSQYCSTIEPFLNSTCSLRKLSVHNILKLQDINSPKFAELSDLHEQISDECWAKYNDLGMFEGFKQDSAGYAVALEAVTQEMVAKFNDLVAQEMKAINEINNKQKLNEQ